MNEQRFPAGWGAERVKQLIEHYESLSEDEQVAEDEAALDTKGTTLIAVPTELADEVQALIARKRIAKPTT